MYKKIQKALRTEKLVLTIVLSVMGILALSGTATYLSVLRNPDSDSLDIWGAIGFFIIPAAIFAALAVTVFGYKPKLNRMWKQVGINSEEEAETFIEQAEPLESTGVPMFWLNGDTVVNFSTLSAYYVTDITKLEKSDFPGNSDTAESHDILIKLRKHDKLPRKDRLHFFKETSRNFAYDKLTEAYKRLGDDENLI